MEQESDNGGETLTINKHTVPLEPLRAALLFWWNKDGRSFPWRSTANSFHILMAEMMLRRTQARQVVPVYIQFIEDFPDPQSLAVAPPEYVSRALYSLGLSWRVPAFQQLAHVLVDRYGGAVPDNYDALTTLPGVGDYVAAAVCSFAFDQPLIIADTNTVRVAGRIFGIATHAESRRRQPVRDILKALLDRQRPRAYNYTLLDLAALICTPSDPDCQHCPIRFCCTTGMERSHA